MKIDKRLEAGTIISDDDFPKEETYCSTLRKTVEVELVSEDHGYENAGIISKCGKDDYLIYVFKTGETEWHSRNYIEQDCYVVSKPKKKVSAMNKDINVGDMVKFGYVYPGCDLNDRYALYLGEKPSSNPEVINESFWVCGDSRPLVVDKTLVPYVCKAT